MKDNLIISTPSVIDMDFNKKIGNFFIVDKKQPISIHKAVEQLAYYFSREFNYDFIQYTAYQDRYNTRSNAYIWIDADWDDTFAIGAANFRFLGDVGQINKWSLDWVWFHPYYRNKGLLTQSWKHFEKKYGKNFHVEPPLSRGMISFLNKINEAPKA
jgi:hypothetical protein